MADMVNRLDAATAALKRAQEAEVMTRQRAQDRARQEIAAAKAKVDVARADLAAAIVEAANDGVRQVEIVRATGYNRERVRQILRAGGVEAPD